MLFYHKTNNIILLLYYNFQILKWEFVNVLVLMFYSYQRRKREGKIVKPPISQLSKQEKKKMRQQWRRDQRKHRDRKRAMEDILNFTPESREPPAELEPNPPNKDDIVSVDAPKASLTPQREACSRWKREKAKLCRKMQKIKQEVEVAKRELVPSLSW